jgi:uncharacterized membrane protein
LVHGVGLYRLRYILLSELLLRVLYIRVCGAEAECFLLGLLQVYIGLTEIKRQGNDLCIVVLLYPLDHAGGIEPS